MGAKMVKWMSDNSVTWALSGQIPVKKAVLESAEFKKLQNRQVFQDSIPDTIMWSNIETSTTSSPRRPAPGGPTSS